MKFFCLLWNHSRGIRTVAVILATVSFFSLYVTVQIAGKLRYAKAQYDFAAESALEDAYYFNSFGLSDPTPDGLKEYHDFIKKGGWDNLLSELSEKEGVKTLGYLAGSDGFIEKRFYNPAEPDVYPKEATIIGITLISPGILEIFPTLKELMPFDDPSAAYLLGDCFPDAEKGDTVEGFSTSRVDGTAVFPAFKLAGRLPSPLPFPRGNGSSTNLDAEVFTTVLESPRIFLLDTPENIAFLKSVEMGYGRSGGFFLEYTEGATEQQKGEIKQFLAKYGSLAPTKDVKESLEKNFRERYIAQLPLSCLLLGVTFVTYISMIVLTVHKKGKETAVAYLCGASKRKNALLMTSLLFLVMLVPAILNLLYILFADRLAAMRLISTDLMMIDGFSALVVLLYCAVMLALAGLIVYGMMGKKSPIAYFREATK